jgi:hypothetical protein
MAKRTAAILGRAAAGYKLSISAPTYLSRDTPEKGTTPQRVIDVRRTTLMM